MTQHWPMDGTRTSSCGKMWVPTRMCDRSSKIPPLQLLKMSHQATGQLETRALKPTFAERSRALERRMWAPWMMTLSARGFEFTILPQNFRYHVNGQTCKRSRVSNRSK
jgi:hypothetical protein